MTKSARNRLTGTFVFLCVLSLHKLRAETAIPSTPAGQVLKAWLSAYNSADLARAEQYTKTFAPNTSPVSVLTTEAQTGGYNLLSVEGSEPTHISFVVQRRRDKSRDFGSLFVSEAARPHVVQLDFQGIPPKTVVEKVVLNTASRQSVLDGITSALQEYYVDPQGANAMIANLKAQQEVGAYATITDGDVFADRLTNELRSVGHDKHLGVDFHPFRFPADGEESEQTQLAAKLQQKNCFFEKVEILPGNIGYLKFNAFMSPALCGRTLAAAMGFVAHAHSLIFDLRDNGGGDPAMVTLIASYLFTHSTHMNDLYTRKGNTTKQFWTVPYVEGVIMGTQPVFVLTSAHTFSGAEEFSYDLQMQKRAKVVGEVTAGGAHPVSGHPIGPFFDVGVPWGKAINPVSNSSWEGTGVTPDLLVPADQALSTAQRLALESMASK